MNRIKFLKHCLLALPGWHTKRKLVVIQSDDWGSIRMPTLKIRKELDSHPLIRANSPYCHYDTLASPVDLEFLFDVVTSVKDSSGNHPVITANCVVANPNFKKIKENDYREYYYYNLKETFERYGNIKALELWHEGMTSNIFHPQYHGREHVNVPAWLNNLRLGNEGVRYAFDREVFGVDFQNIGQRKSNFQAAWDFNNAKDEEVVRTGVLEGLKLFEELFKFKSITAIAPSYTWSNNLEKLLNAQGVKVMQSIVYQKIPNSDDNKYKKSNRLFSCNGRKSQIRNAFFEVPSVTHNVDLSEIFSRAKISFQFGKPLIIGSHRLNFVGVHNEKYRDQNLAQFRALLRGLVQRWPDLEFVSSENLVKLMDTQESNLV